MNPFKAFFRMLKDDIKTITTTAKRIKNDEPIFNPERVKEFKAEMKSITVGGYIKDNWIWILTIIFAGVMGWVIAANYYSIQANNFIITNCAPENMQAYYDLTKVALNNSSNVTFG